jgi:hypothetical protein
MLRRKISINQQPENKINKRKQSVYKFRPLLLHLYPTHLSPISHPASRHISRHLYQPPLLISMAVKRKFEVEADDVFPVRTAPSSTSLLFTLY